MIGTNAEVGVQVVYHRCWLLCAVLESLLFELAELPFRTRIVSNRVGCSC